MPVIVMKYAYRPEGTYRADAKCRCGHCQPGATRCAGRDTAPRAIPDTVAVQLEKVHALRMDLVAVEHAHDDAVKALWSSVPAVAAVEARLEQTGERITAFLNAAREARVRARKAVTPPDTAAELRHLRQEEKDLRAQRRQAITVAKRDHPELAARRKDLDVARAAELAACRKRHTDAGLYWGSANMAMQDHGTAVKLVEAHRRKGRSARLRTARHDGTGTIAVYVMRQSGSVTQAERDRVAALDADGVTPGAMAGILAGEGFPERDARTVSLILRGIRRGGVPPKPRPADPPRSPALLASGTGKWRNVLAVSPWMPPGEFDGMTRSERNAIARSGRVRMYTGSAVAEIPVVVHRMLPAEADVVQATLTVTRLAGKWDMSVQVTARVPDSPRAPGEVVAVHTGWRTRGDGSARVAVWASRVPLEVPGHLAEVAVPSGGGERGEIIVPAAWLAHAAHPDGIRGVRDIAMEPVREKVAAWLDEHPQEWGGRPLRGSDVRRWRSPARLAALALAWRAAAPAGDGGGEIAGVLEEWRHRDKHLWTYEANERDQQIRRRDDVWRKVAAWLASSAGHLVADDSDLSVLRRVPGLQEDDPVFPGMVAARARARAVVAAPGRLRSLVAAAAPGRGVVVTEVESAYLSRTCPACSATGGADARYAEAAVVACPACGHRYDQDMSAAALMLERARDANPEPPR